MGKSGLRQMLVQERPSTLHGRSACKHSLDIDFPLKPTTYDLTPYSYALAAGGSRERCIALKPTSASSANTATGIAPTRRMALS